MADLLSTEIVSGLRLRRLCSPLLPIGSFTWSQGLETAVDRSWIYDLESAFDWIAAQLEHSLASTEGAFLTRIYRSFSTNDRGKISDWNDLLLACRESKELLEEDQEQGELLHKLNCLHYPGLDSLLTKYSLPAAFAEGLWAGGISLEEGIAAFFWMWIESQTNQIIKLIPLGLKDGQALLDRLMQKVPAACAFSLNCADEDVGVSLLGRSLASAWHETQYCRIYRS